MLKGSKSPAVFILLSPPNFSAEVLPFGVLYYADLNEEITFCCGVVKLVIFGSVQHDYLVDSAILA